MNNSFKRITQIFLGLLVESLPKRFKISEKDGLAPGFRQGCG
jgi:hypothetical protein